MDRMNHQKKEGAPEIQTSQNLDPQALIFGEALLLMQQRALQSLHDKSELQLQYQRHVAQAELYPRYYYNRGTAYEQYLLWQVQSLGMHDISIMPGVGHGPLQAGLAVPSVETLVALPTEVATVNKSVPKNIPKRKAARDKDKPKRAMSAYNVFFKMESQRMKIASKHKRTVEGALKPVGLGSSGDTAKVIAARWQQLTTSDRQVYKNEATKDTVRHKEEMKVYLDKCAGKKEESSP